jgi:hypothetical protein
MKLREDSSMSSGKDRELSELEKRIVRALESAELSKVVNAIGERNSSEDKSVTDGFTAGFDTKVVNSRKSRHDDFRETDELD